MSSEFKQQDSIAQEIQNLRYAGDFENAILKCKVAIDRFPTDNFFHKILGDIYLQIGNYSNAAAEHLINLKLIGSNTRLFKNFIRFFRLFIQKAPDALVLDYLQAIRNAIQNQEFSPEIVECLITSLGTDVIVDKGLLSIIEQSSNDRNIKTIRSKIQEWEDKKDIVSIRALIKHRINNPDWIHCKQITRMLVRVAERTGLYDDVLLLLDSFPAKQQNHEITCTILRTCRRLSDYSYAEKTLTLDDQFITRADFNNQYELVYYFQSKKMADELEKTLKAMRRGSTSSIPIARTLYNFYLSLERFDEAQEVYDIIQRQIAQKAAAKSEPRQEEQIETEQAVWRKLKDLVSEQEHNRQLVALRDLLRGFSHELGQPITNIRYAVQLHQMKMERGLDDRESMKQLMNNVLEQTTRVGSLLNRFRPIVSSKAKDEWFSIVGCIEEVFEDLKDRIQAQDIRHTIYGNRTISIYGDKVQFSQVIYNLVLNSMQAIGDMCKGKVDVKVSHENNEIKVTFADNGPGIPIENQQKVFEPFFSTKDPTSGNGGEGLGLFIVWNIIKMFDGSISIDRYYRNGAKFVITIPDRNGGISNE